MRNILLLILPFILCAGGIKKAVLGGHKLTMAEAQLILGQPCHLKKDTVAVTAGGHKYDMVFWANSTNEKTVKTTALYFSFESFVNAAAAAKKFIHFKTSNAAHDGFETLKNTGDEAFFMSDNQNFCLLIAHKQNEMVLFKINKLSAKTSISELKKIATAVMARI